MANEKEINYVNQRVNARDWNLQKESDQRTLLRLANLLLKGHRGKDILLHEKVKQEISFNFDGIEYDVAEVDDSPGIEGLVLIEYSEENDE